MKPTVSSSAPSSDKAPLRDRIIPWYFVMAFAVVFAVNAFFIYMATQTHTGVVTENAYEKGLAYNDMLEKAHAQEALGWQSSITFQKGSLIVTLSDENGAKLEDASVTAYLKNATHDTTSYERALNDTQQGTYAADVSDIPAGKWFVTIEALWQDKPYQKSVTMHLP